MGGREEGEEGQILSRCKSVSVSGAMLIYTPEVLTVLLISGCEDNLSNMNESVN